MIGLVSKPNLPEPSMNTYNHRGMTVPDLKKVPGCFILPSAECSQIFFPGALFTVHLIAAAC